MPLDDETRRLTGLLRKKVRESGLSYRQIEREAGFGHGTVGNLLRGKTELRIRHIAAVGRAINVPVEDFFLEAFSGPPLSAGPAAPGEPTAVEPGLPPKIQGLLEEVDLELRGIQLAIDRQRETQRLFQAFRRHLVGFPRETPEA
jgi:transcriptional regulator with XRE-family HTH domain